jgi:hypothetical protein
MEKWDAVVQYEGSLVVTVKYPGEIKGMENSIKLWHIKIMQPLESHFNIFNINSYTYITLIKIPSSIYYK